MTVLKYFKEEEQLIIQSEVCSGKKKAQKCFKDCLFIDSNQVFSVVCNRLGERGKNRVVSLIMSAL